MAIGALTDAYILINGVVLSANANSVTVNDERDPVEITAFGAVNKAYIKGLGDATMEVTMFQDFAAGKVHATLQPLVGSTTPFTIEVRPTSQARSATNPAAVMTALLMNYSMLDGDVGETSEITATFQNASQTGISYLTA